MESSTTVRHVDFSEDNEANDAELRITYTTGSSSNIPPTANNDSATTVQNTAVVITVVANDTDPDGTINPATVIITGAPLHGIAVAYSNGTVTYTPNAGYTGTDTFTYTVKDNNGAISNGATVTVTVTPSHSEPAPHRIHRLHHPQPCPTRRDGYLHRTRYGYRWDHYHL